jgi:hypothetical protein
MYEEQRTPARNPSPIKRPKPTISGSTQRERRHFLQTPYPFNCEDFLLIKATDVSGSGKSYTGTLR